VERAVFFHGLHHLLAEDVAVHHADSHTGGSHHTVVRHHCLPPGHSREDTFPSSGESCIVVKEHLTYCKPQIPLCNSFVDHQPVPCGKGAHVHKVRRIAVVVFHPVLCEHSVAHRLSRLVVAHGAMGPRGHHDGNARRRYPKAFQFGEERGQHFGRRCRSGHIVHDNGRRLRFVCGNYLLQRRPCRGILQEPRNFGGKIFHRSPAGGFQDRKNVFIRNRERNSLLSPFKIYIHICTIQPFSLAQRRASSLHPLP